MSFWTNDNEYKVKLMDFIERFVAHNIFVRLFKEKRLNEDGHIEWEYITIWKGMEWQITEGYINSDYFRTHPDVEPCPYAEANVIKVTSVGISGEFGDEASLVIEVEE